MPLNISLHYIDQKGNNEIGSFSSTDDKKTVDTSGTVNNNIVAENRKFSPTYMPIGIHSTNLKNGFPKMYTD